MSTEPPSNLALRTAPLAWSHDSAAGRLEGLEWVDAELVAQPMGNRQTRGPDGKERYQQRSYLTQLPPSVAEAALEAQAKGEVSGWEGQLLVFARAEWLIAARNHLWAPWAPVPILLAQLVEAFGVEAAVHKFDGARLARLAALLPRWHPHRGTTARAGEILDAAGEGHQMDSVIEPLPTGEAAPEAEDTAPSETAREVFACRGADWWAKRAEANADAVYRISGGLLRFQPHAGKAFGVRREDLLLKWVPGQSIPRELLRLLPVWTVARTIANMEKNA